MQSANASTLFLSVGGGPVVVHPRLTNLNIGPFANVDIVADAHELPYGDASVDGIYCEAVLEHLSDPAKAVAEMYRVLKPGALVFAATPFLQAFHGYPNHFQNFTRVGHERLFTSQGFMLVESGGCVGPINALLTLNARAIGLYIPGLVGKLMKATFQLVTLWMRPLDYCIARHPHHHMLASTTYVLVKK
jgi:SAM-dependent methyltransferase